METLFGCWTTRLRIIAAAVAAASVLLQAGHGLASRTPEESAGLTTDVVQRDDGVAQSQDDIEMIPIAAALGSARTESPATFDYDDGQIIEVTITADTVVLGGVDYATPMGALETAQSAAAGDDFDSDPWEAFNERMFWFNREILDRFLLKPLATAWDFLLPDPVQRGIHNMFDNLAVVRRVVNNSFQAKFAGAATELARFSINSTVGLVGFFDVAKDGFGIEQRDEDAGQTFGVWGMGPGPYLVLPFLPPLSVRDGIGYALDAVMTPYSYFIPWYASLGATGSSTVNERSLNLDRFERVVESTVDLYSAVRNAYLQRRAAAIRQ